MKRYIKPIWQAFVYKFLQSIFFLSERLPLRMMLALGAALGVLAFRLSARYRKVGLKNLTIAYGDGLSHREKLAIVRKVFVNFAKAAMEFPVAARMSPAAIRDLVELSPVDKQLIDRLFERKKGIVAVSAHLGNFEIMARRVTMEGYKISVVVRNDNNKAMADLINNIRSQSGYEVIGRGEAAKPLLKKLRAGEAVVMLPDQKSDDVFVPFFGEVCGTVAGPAVVALRTQSPILPVFCVRLPGDKHRIVLGTPIEPTVTADRDADIERVMVQVNEEIEKIVRAYPEQWLWLHDRWRVKPPAEVAARWEALKETRQPISAAS